MFAEQFDSERSEQHQTAVAFVGTEDIWLWHDTLRICPDERGLWGPGVLQRARNPARDWN